jgi:hypothetical protein
MQRNGWYDNKQGNFNMARVYTFLYKERQIFCLDVSGLQLKDKPEFQKLVDTAREEIEKYPPKSALVITNVANTGFDTEVAAIMGEYATHNTPYVKASVAVGVSGVQKVVLAAIKALTGRDFYVVDSMEEAQEWLVKQY